MTEQKFTETYVNVGDLSIDRVVQRSSVDLRKVERLKKHWNDAAVGYLVVSKRNAVDQIIIDGQHRWLAYAQLSDNQGQMMAQVFEGLTLQQEAQLFLDTNYANQPTLIDKFRVRVITEDPVAVEVTKTLKSYGWIISPSAQNGNAQAVGSLERVHKLGLSWKEKFEDPTGAPDLLSDTVMVITHAWGLDRSGLMAVILEGVAALIHEDDVNLDLDRLRITLQNYPGGPMGLHTDARAVAALKRGQVSMAVSSQLTDFYNKGRKTKTLSPWRRNRL